MIPVSLEFETRKVQAVASCSICSMDFTNNKLLESIYCGISTRWTTYKFRFSL